MRQSISSKPDSRLQTPASSDYQDSYHQNMDLIERIIRSDSHSQSGIFKNKSQISMTSQTSFRDLQSLSMSQLRAIKQNGGIQQEGRNSINNQKGRSNRYSLKDSIVLKATKSQLSQKGELAPINEVVSSYTQNQQQPAFMNRRRNNNPLSHSEQRPYIPSTTQQHIKKNLDSVKQEYRELLNRLSQQLTSMQYQKLFVFITSPTFHKLVKDRFNNASSIQHTIKDTLNINLKTEDISTLIQFVSVKEDSPDKQTKITSGNLNDLPMLNNQYKDNRYNESPRSKYSEVTRSTSFSRPFTCLSFVSQSSLGSSLTQKIDRLNKVTIKSVCKSLLQCQKQIEQVLNSKQLTLKNLLTVNEIVMYLQQTDCNLTFTQLQNILTAVLLIQNVKGELMINLKSILRGCQNYIDQSDIDQKDFFNKTKFDKVLDELRDSIYLKQGGQDMRGLFIKITETDQDKYQKTVLTQDQFTKFSKSILGDKFSVREIEQIYRNIVSQKVLTFKRFTKIMSHKQVEEVWLQTGIKQLRDYIIKKKLTSQLAFERFTAILGAKESGKISKQQFRDLLRREQLPFNMPQTDFLFSKFDSSQEGFIDVDKWTQHIHDDHLNPLNYLRDTVVQYNLTGADILHRLKRKYTDEPLNYNQFKEALTRIDSSMTGLQIRNLFEQMRDTEDNKVSIPHLLNNLTGEQTDTVDFKKSITKTISDYVTKNNLMPRMREMFEKIDVNNDGKVNPEQLLQVLKQLKLPIPVSDIERYINHLSKDTKNRMSYQKLLDTYENTKESLPVKAVAVRLVVFLKQNNLSNKQLLDKLLQTRKQTGAKNLNHSISIGFFAKFIKAKVDKKRSIEELREIIKAADLDKDGFINENDLEGFLGRVGFQEFFQRNNRSSMNGESSMKFTPMTETKTRTSQQQLNTMGNGRAISFLSSSMDESASQKLFPSEKLGGSKIIEVVKRIKSEIKDKNWSITETFKRLDITNSGLLSFNVFSKQIDQVCELSQHLKEKLFARMDTMNIGLVSFDQFRDFMALSNEKLRDENGSNNISDSFDWEQDVIKKITEWMREKNLSCSEAFKIIDQDFDGNISINDLRSFLSQIMQFEEQQLIPTKLERLHKIMDLSKSGKIFQSDFENMFSQISQKKLVETLSQSWASSSFKSRVTTSQTSQSQKEQELVFDWQKGCIYQIGAYLLKKYSSVQESFESSAFNSFNEAFKYFCKISGENFKVINFEGFHKVISDLLPGRFDHKQINQIWNEITSGETMNKSTFHYQFGHLTFKSQTKIQDNLAKNLSKSHFTRSQSQQIPFKEEGQSYQHLEQLLLQSHHQSKASGQFNVSQQSNIDSVTSSLITSNMALDKLRRCLKTQSFSSIAHLFEQRLTTNIIEFKTAMKRIGMSTKEIDTLMEIVSVNSEGMLDLNIINQRLSKYGDEDEMIDKRNANKLSQIKQMLYEVMTSPEDAFRMFDKENKGRLTYQDFQNLISHLYKAASRELPNYPIIKDLFDSIDIRKDGIIDFTEWSKTFIKENNSFNNSHSFYASSLVNLGQFKKDNGQWQTSKEYSQVMALLSKNRKNLQQQFKQQLTHPQNTLEYSKSQQILESFIKPIMPDIMTEQIDKIIMPFKEMVQGGEYIMKYEKFLNVIKDRQKSKESFPKQI